MNVPRQIVPRQTSLVVQPPKPSVHGCNCLRASGTQRPKVSQLPSHPMSPQVRPAIGVPVQVPLTQAYPTLQTMLQAPQWFQSSWRFEQ